MSTEVKSRRILAPEESPEEALRYRRPMMACEVMVFSGARGTYGCAVCPRCGLTGEREYMVYCDRYGQYLDWRDFKNVTIVYPGPDRGRN